MLPKQISFRHGCCSSFCCTEKNFQGVKMKQISVLIALVLVAIGCVCCNQKSDGPKVRVGIYDSRAIAVAFVWSDWHRKSLVPKMAEMEKAKATGDTKKIRELNAWGNAQQARCHRQGFSTAPVDDILEYIKDTLPQIAKDANVIALVSKWDKKTLRRYKSAELIDVTDLMVAPFNPKEKQLKTIEHLKKIKPIPLWKLELMMKFGNI